MPRCMIALDLFSIISNKNCINFYKNTLEKQIIYKGKHIVNNSYFRIELISYLAATLT